MKLFVRSAGIHMTRILYSKEYQIKLEVMGVIIYRNWNHYIINRLIRLFRQKFLFLTIVTGTQIKG